nr:MAG TPA: hypothetical protein [Caudoviricetes sp.]
MVSTPQGVDIFDPNICTSVHMSKHRSTRLDR